MISPGETSGPSGHDAGFVACGSGHGRCFALPDSLDYARTTCTPKGRCKFGWIIAEGGRTSIDVWLDVHIGEGPRRRQKDW